MYTPVKIHKLSATQTRKLQKGDKVIIKKGNDEEWRNKLKPRTRTENMQRKRKLKENLELELDWLVN